MKRIYNEPRIEHKAANLAGRERWTHCLIYSQTGFTFVLNAMIIIAGFAAWLNVDVRELPDVDTPVTTIVTMFSGASAETIDREVTKVIEDAVSRVSGVKTISSTSSFGRSRVQINFNVGVDLNVAASDIRDALSRIAYSLPKMLMFL